VISVNQICKLMSVLLFVGWMEQVLAADANVTQPTAPGVTTAQTMNLSAPAIAPQGHCPCDFSTLPSGINNGDVTCASTNMIVYEGNVPTPVMHSISIISRDSDKALAAGTDKAAKISASVIAWNVGEHADTIGNSEKFCSKNMISDPGSVVQIDDAQFKACINDIKRAASTIGLSCVSLKQ